MIRNVRKWSDVENVVAVCIYQEEMNCKLELEGISELELCNENGGTEEKMAKLCTSPYLNPDCPQSIAGEGLSNRRLVRSILRRFHCHRRRVYLESRRRWYRLDPLSMILPFA